jgi:OmpA-OmpF porin, OOP family
MKKIVSMFSRTKMTAMAWLALVFLLPLSAHAEVKDGSIELNPFAGFNFFENRQNLESTLIYGGRIGYNIVHGFGIEGTAEFVNSQVDNRSRTGTAEGEYRSPTNDVNVYYYHVDAIYHFMHESRFNPFIVAGAGAVHYEPRISDRYLTTVDFGIGAKYWMTDHVALRVDLRDNMVVDEAYHNVNATAGIVFAFGGKSKAAPAEAVMAQPQPQMKPEPEPAPVPAPAAEPVPAPVPAAEPAPGHFKYCVTLHGEFDIDRALIRSEYREEIAHVGEFMKKYPTTTAVIEGHADNIGSAEHNLELSKRRAEAVVNYLVDTFKIDRSRLEARGFGITRPVADNATDEGRQKNRRIEAIIDCAFDVKEVTPPKRLCMSLVVDFDPGKSDIKPIYRDEIAKVADFMKKYPTTTAVIEGHTDNVGGAEYNMKLSLERAQHVVNYLVRDFGIDPSRLSAKGYGDTRRIAYNGTAEGRARNRRINAVIDCVISK